MPLYDFRCAKGHEFERFVPLVQFDYAQRCKCGAIAERFLPRAPVFNVGTISDDLATYAQHNVTFTGESRDGEGCIGFTPNSHDDQCQCEKCCRHRKRAIVTETADKGKDVQLCP